LNSWNVCIVSIPEPEDCVSYPANDPQLPLALVSAGGVMSSFEIEDEGLIVDANVLLDITCNSTSALEVKLQAPSGDMIMLFNEVDNDGLDFNNTGLDDEGAYSIYVGFPPFRNTYLPGQPLSTFDGQSITGTWQLYVTDLGGGGIGTINSWSLCLKTVPEQEGEGENEGEGETPNEGEGEAITEGETPYEGEAEIEGEGETLSEGEGEAVVEGETPAEGEGENEGEGEDAGCCKAEGKDLTLKDLIEKTLGDWLVIGLVMMTSLAMSMSTKRGL